MKSPLEAARLAALAILLSVSVEAADPAPVDSAGGAARRPKIGLALGGGGALGIAHVGVLRVLEEMRIPVDFIAGTSMGSIIGGLYASGMSPDEIQAFLESLDWVEVMSDNTPRGELYFRRKQDDRRYMLELGLQGRSIRMGTGVAAGQKFNNEMQFITLRSAAVTNFNELPIPYRAVATDLESGGKYVMDHGSLATAMRASMAVPGVFTPVEMDGRILVDGGVVDNLPVDVAKEMGADVVIAVDVGSDADVVDKESLRSLGGILGRTYTIAQRPGQVEMLRRADIGIQPALAGFTASQFERVRELVPKGEKAARDLAARLSRHSVSEEEFQKHLAGQRRPQPEGVRIQAIRISGNQRVSEDAIRGRIRSEPGTPLDLPTVRRDLMRVYGLGEFSQVLAKVRPAGDGLSLLEYAAMEKPWGPLYLKYGLQLRSDFDHDADWRMLVNVTRMSLNRLGAEWRNEIEFGSTQRVFSEFYQPLRASGWMFLAPNAEYVSDLQDVYSGDERIAEYDVDRFIARFDLGVQLRQYAELRVGPMWGSGKARTATGASDLPEIDETFGGWAFKIQADRRDRTLFPRKGYLFSLQGEFAEEYMGTDEAYDRMYGVARQYFSSGDHYFVLGAEGGSSLGTDLPAYAQYRIGGPQGFSGLKEDQFRGSYLAAATAGYSYRFAALPSSVGSGVYAVTRFDVGNVWDDEIDTDDLRYGFAAGVCLDTVIGPVYLLHGRADGGLSSTYVSLGAYF
jgi:NTE family protein